MSLDVNKISDSPLLIWFSDSERFDVLNETVTPVPQEHFRFHNYNELLANSNTQLPGNSLTICFSHVQHCDRLLRQGARRTGAMVLTPQSSKASPSSSRRSPCDVSVSLSMFDAQAVSFHINLDRFKGDPRVVLTTGIDPKIVGGNLPCSTYDG
ncbi:hypothetical protein Bca4012_052609 [Brassica carinata]